VLSAADNELLTRTGAGTAMGEKHRSFTGVRGIAEQDQRFGSPTGRVPS